MLILELFAELFREISVQNYLFTYCALDVAELWCSSTDILKFSRCNISNQLFRVYHNTNMKFRGVALTMRVWSSSKLLKKKKALHDVVDQELAFSLLNASWSLAYALKHCILPNEIRNWLCQEQQVQHGTRGCGGVCFTFYLLGKLQLQRGSSKDEWDWIENHVSF